MNDIFQMGKVRERDNGLHMMSVCVCVCVVI